MVSLSRLARYRLPLRTSYQIYRMDPEDTLLVVEEGVPILPIQGLYLATMRARTPMEAIVAWQKVLQTPPGVEVFVREHQRGIWAVEVVASSEAQKILAGYPSENAPDARFPRLIEAAERAESPEPRVAAATPPSTPALSPRFAASLTMVRERLHARYEAMVSASRARWNTGRATWSAGRAQRSVRNSRELSDGASVGVTPWKQKGLQTLGAGQAALRRSAAWLRHRCDVNARDEAGRTALMRAASEGRTLRVTLLLALGANREARDSQDQTALMLAAMGLTFGTAAHRVRIVKALLTRGADIHARDQEGNTALLCAARRGQTETMQVLIDRGAEVDATAEDGMTPLLLALRNASLAIVPLLLACGADVHARSRTGETALMLAAGRGTVKLIQALLNAGIDVNATNDLGETALLSAIWYGNTAVASLLLTHGADLHLRDKFGNTALSAASSGGKVFLVQLLERAGATRS